MIMDYRRSYRPARWLTALAIAVCLVWPAVPNSAYAKTWPTVRVKGIQTSWQLTMLQIRKMDRIPNTQWTGYGRHIFVFWVLSLRMTNTGHISTSIQNDLELTLRKLPKYRTDAAPGWTGLSRSSTSDQLTAGAAKDFGGALPWIVTHPGATTTYCLVIGTHPDEAHFGFYNADPTTGYTLLFDTGY